MPNPELVVESESGLLFEPGDTADLARRLELLIRNPALRDRLAAAAVQRIRRHFTLAESAERMAAIYRSFLETKSPGLRKVQSYPDQRKGRQVTSWPAWGRYDRLPFNDAVAKGGAGASVAAFLRGHRAAVTWVR